MEATFKTSMTCGGCLNKVRPLLDSEPTITHWEADLDDPRKLVRTTLTDDGSTSCVVSVFHEAGFDAVPIDNDDAVADINTSNDKPAFTLSTYKPLFLVVTYVIGGALLFEARQDTWEWTRVMSNFMGFFFIGFAFFKLLNIEKFADAFSTYDVIAKRSRAYALSYPWIEVGLGLLFVTQIWLFAANLVTAVIMSVGLVGVIAAVRKKQAIQCACLGTAFNLPMSTVTIIENGVMIVMAVGMLFA
ncbi:heavy-metal-associated domain-containing protein [Novipirellula maiorica]|uniref:heavy-metal-associated domain-containing protein n=1 Tax=Novipirellula maiorica TaxID=1265734 RepID=UPI000595146B|nr:MauE/DoxX family redox-associated membrane protein [Rhodopirellula maiorica]